MWLILCYLQLAALVLMIHFTCYQGLVIKGSFITLIIFWISQLLELTRDMDIWNWYF